MASENITILQDITNSLLSLMGTKATATVTEDSGSDMFVVNIDTEDETGLLIGSHGDTLNSIQSVVGMMYRTRVGEWKRILVNVADWREKQEEKLNHLAETTAQRVVETGESVPLYNLNPAQRRIVHMHLSERSDVQTESVGEGEERHLVVHPADK